DVTVADTRGTETRDIRPVGGGPQQARISGNRGNNPPIVRTPRVSLKFVSPWFLPPLPIPPLLWLWRRRARRGALRYPSLALLKDIPRSRSPRWGGEGLRLLALTAAILALTQPRTPDLKTRLPAHATPILFCP